MESATATRGADTANPKPPEPEPEDDGSGIPGGAQPQDDVGPPTPAAELPDDGGEPEEEPEDEGLTIGGYKKLGVKVGGRVPDTSVLKLKGSKISLDGQFDRGDRFPTVSILQVTGDNDNDTINTLTGAIKSTSKAQSATLCGITTLEKWLAEHLPSSLAPQVFKALELEMPEQMPLPAE